MSNIFCHKRVYKDNGFFGDKCGFFGDFVPKFDKITIFFVFSDEKTLFLWL